MACFLVTIFIFDWRMKAFFLFGMHIIHFSLINDFNNSEYLTSAASSMILIILICFLFRSMSQTLNDYLEILQGKFLEE